MTVDSHYYYCVSPPKGLWSLRPRLAFQSGGIPLPQSALSHSIKKLINTPSLARSADKAYDSCKKRQTACGFTANFK